MHADRTNRFALGLIGLLALVLGVGGLLAAAGVFSSNFQRGHLVDNRFSRYVGQHGNWLWPAIAAVAFVIVLLALVWLLKLLSSTDRAHGVDVAVARPQDAGDVGGKTTMAPGALTAAVANEIDSYRGVTSSKARMLGDPGSPTLAIEVTASRQVRLAALTERIEQGAVAHARQAVGDDSLPVKLDVSVSGKAVSRTI